MKAYIASPIGTKDSVERINAARAAEILLGKGISVYCPWEKHIPNEFLFPNPDWGLMVFSNDVAAIGQCDVLVLLSYGHTDTTGSSWEAGFAFGTGKKVIVVEMKYPSAMSLMVSNGCYARVVGLSGLENYSFKDMPASRTLTKQE